MAKKKEGSLDKVLDALTEDATAEELLSESGLLNELKKRLGEGVLDAFEAACGEQPPMFVKTWGSRWDNVIRFLAYPEPIRKGNYTTNKYFSESISFRRSAR